MASAAESEGEVHCLRTTMPSMSRFRKARAFFHDLPGRSGFGAATSGAPASQARVSFVTRENVERSFMVLREGHQLDRNDLQHVQTLLSRCPRTDNILEVLDDSGWNILQRVIICNQPQVASMLIARGGLDLNAGVCTSPLHLACKLGHATIVQMLLDGGARADIARRVCYPVAHHLKPAVGARKPARFQCRVALRVPVSPVAYAIPNDRHEVLQVLLTHRASRDVIKKDFLVHEACKFRAKRCLRILVACLPEQVNIRDRKGFTPLQHALRGPRNRDCAVILLESGAQFDVDIFETDYGTLLHEMYISDDTTHLLRLTELMLATGPEDLATAVTCNDGDTLLNKLLKYFGSATPRDREQYVDEVRQCIELLIKHGCDPNQVNKKGESALHSLLAHHGGRPLFYQRDRFSVAPAYLLTLLDNMRPLMETLLQYGANANLMAPPNVVSPLYYLMRVVCSMSPSLLGATAEQVKACVRVLCRRGADPNIINAFGDNAITLLLSSLSRWLYHASDDPNRLDVLLHFTDDMLCLFLTHGLDARTVLRKNLKQFVIIFNSTILDAAFVQHLNRLLRRVIRAGGDPNRFAVGEMAVGAGSRKYTVNYYLARGLYIHSRYHNRSAFDILDVFRTTLSRRHLDACVAGICASIEDEYEAGERSADVCQRVRAIGASPRALKTLCRIAVCCAIRWHVDRHARSLPLPTALQDYIYSLE